MKRDWIGIQVQGARNDTNVNTNKTIDLFTDRYGSYIELIRFEEYYGMSSGV